MSRVFHVAVVSQRPSGGLWIIRPTLGDSPGSRFEKDTQLTGDTLCPLRFELYALCDFKPSPQPKFFAKDGGQQLFDSGA